MEDWEGDMCVVHEDAELGRVLVLLLLLVMFLLWLKDKERGGKN